MSVLNDKGCYKLKSGCDISDEFSGSQEMACGTFAELMHTCWNRVVVRFLRLDVVSVECFRIL